MSGQLDSLADLPPGKSPSTHCAWGKLGQKTGWMFWRRAKSLTSPGNQTLHFPACSPFAVLVGCSQLLRSVVLGLNCAATEVVNSGMVESLYMYCSTCVFIQNNFQLIWKLFDSQVTKFVGNFEWWLIPSKCFFNFYAGQEISSLYGAWTNFTNTTIVHVCACSCLWACARLLCSTHPILLNWVTLKISTGIQIVQLLGVCSPSFLAIPFLPSRYCL